MKGTGTSMKDCAYCFNQRHLEGPEGEYAPCPACRTKPEPHRDPRGAMEAAVQAITGGRRVSNYCHDDIVCPDCKEHTTRHEPCCPGTPTCECLECADCGELFPEEELTARNICEDCIQRRKDDHEYAKTLDYVGAWWSSDQ